MPSNPRSADLADLVREVVEGLGDSGITPADGMIVADLVLWTLMENSLKLAQTVELQQQARIIAMRVVTRLASRIEAWPAKPSERN